MDIHRLATRQLGLAAAVTLAVGLVATGTADAARPARASASLANDTLTVSGTNGPDAIQLEVPAADPNTLLVDVGNGTRPQSFDRSRFSTIAVFLRGGADQFHVAPGGSLVGDTLIVDGGGGRDTIAGGDGNDILYGGTGADTIDGGDGVDLVFGNAGNDQIDGGRGNDTEFLGAGQDTALWNPGEGSDVIDGGRGWDRLAFNGAGGNEIMSLSANGSHAVFLRDVGTIRMDLDNVEQLDLAALGGVDTITVDDMTGTDIRRANVDLGPADGANDVVTVKGTNRADRIHVNAYHGAVNVTGLRARTHLTGTEPTDQLHVEGLGGNDRITASNAARALIGVAVDLGTGQR
jgi:Ca2+-binding RTX toxin-like protein